MQQNPKQYKYSLGGYFGLLCVFVGCTDLEDTDWVTLYDDDTVQFEDRLSLETPIVQQNIWLTILAERPQFAAKICGKLKDESAKQTCKRYQTRPHLQTISPTEQAHWSGGDLGERTVFPRSFTPLKSELTKVELKPECVNSTVCLQIEAESRSLTSWQEAGYVCSQLKEPLAQSDCLFHIAESLPVHVDTYESAAKLCSLSGGFAGECHNHVLLKFATKMYDRLDWHEQLIAKMKRLYSVEYAQQLETVYWSIVAFRVVGMEYPLDTTRFLQWSDAFKPHLRSIVALRMWEEQNAYQQSQRALKGEMMRVAKARGPNAPRFTPREKWQNKDANMNWIRFCDLRGGHRPTHDNEEIDLAWALLTAFAMGDEFVESRWQEVYDTVGVKHWEVRWAMARLLSDISKESSLYQQLKKDSDTRVLQALY